jgi:F-type H+-transporting ATPase subunit k
MGVLGALFGGSKLALGGGSKAANQTPPINASSNEEADFIKYLAHMPGCLTPSH